MAGETPENGTRLSRRQDDFFQKVLAGLVTMGFVGGGGLVSYAHGNLGDRLEASQRTMAEKVEAQGKNTSDKLAELHVDLAMIKAARDAGERRFDDVMTRQAKLEEVVRLLELRMAREDKRDK